MPRLTAHVETRIDRFRGALLGLATGDALGTSNEFTTSPPPIHDMTGGGPFGLAPGEWTDDTSMALCLADSLIDKQSFDARDQMERYVRWWKTGYNSVRGVCFDIGNTTRAALERFTQTGDAFAGDSRRKAAGNGSLMRLAPIPLFYHSDLQIAGKYAADSSRLTHAAPQAVDACVYYCRLIWKALHGRSKEELFAISAAELDSSIAAIAAGSFLRKRIEELKPSGYVAATLEAALFCFANTSNFKDGCLMAANLGGDADTIAATYGQLAGAFYGETGIPAAWLDRLAWHDRIAAKAEALYEIGARVVAS